MSQTTLAKLSGTAQTQISRYELGLAEPVASTLGAIARALDVSMEWLVGLTDELPDAPRETKELTDIEQQILVMLRQKSNKQLQIIRDLLEEL